MNPAPSPAQYLLSLPPCMAAVFADLQDRQPPRWWAGCDPREARLGSGGGVAWLLYTAWQALNPNGSFAEWLADGKKLLLMAGGQSRRLPAYAAAGKILLPFKALRGIPGQRLDQTLLDVQLPAYDRVLAHASENYRLLMTSGDVLLRFGKDLPPFPDVDVLCLGMWVKPEIASDFGVFFCRRETPQTLDFFLQKPPPEIIHQNLDRHAHLVDTGMWLLSARAIEVLLRRCGWDGRNFAAGVPSYYELYAEFGLSLGEQPTVPDPEISALSSAVVALPKAEFYHLGTSRQLIASVSEIENIEHEHRTTGWTGRQPHPDQHVQNAVFSIPLRRQENHTLWIENACIPATWSLAAEHVLTGIPPNDWTLHLRSGQCLELAPLAGGLWVVRPYHIDDSFKGAIGAPGTRWLGAPAAEWFARRNLPLPIPATDIQQSRIFPAMQREQISGEFIQWMLDPQPDPDASFAQLYLENLVSAEEICTLCDQHTVSEQRRRILSQVIGAFIRNNRWNSFFRLDLQATAATFAPYLPSIPEPPELETMDRMHEQSFRAAILRVRGENGWQEHENAAFREMRQLILSQIQSTKSHPRRNVLEDQIVWARSPIRLDLAGGWSDTPPYCLEYGGSVLNVAVNLNGQPPIQVFAKLASHREIVVRSIDLGLELRLGTFEEIGDFEQLDNFSLAKAALALAGFHPRFCAGGPFSSLHQQLEAFGSGLELTLLSAAPKGSGLGTSSILAATVLGALSELCGLGWDRQMLFQQTLALEQLLTTGGGWQDQAGGLHRGLKIIETSAGLAQRPVLRWLPEHLFDECLRAGTVLLYYTGITRLAKNILQEIVRGLFLNSRAHLDRVDQIKEHARSSFANLQRGDWETLCSTVERSWQLNQQLDPGTNPPAVADILRRGQRWIRSAKLLGAGGGGYLLIFARDPAAAQSLKTELTLHPPNMRARFVHFSISQQGLEITRS